MTERPLTGPADPYYDPAPNVPLGEGFRARLSKDIDSVILPVGIGMMILVLLVNPKMENWLK